MRSPLSHQLPGELTDFFAIRKRTAKSTPRGDSVSGQNIRNINLPYGGYLQVKEIEETEFRRFQIIMED